MDTNQTLIPENQILNNGKVWKHQQNKTNKNTDAKPQTLNHVHGEHGELQASSSKNH